MNDAAPRARHTHATRTPHGRTDTNSNIVIIYNNV